MLVAILSMVGIGGVVGVGLGIAAKKFAVEVDPKVAAINEALPAANCGGCGFAGCGQFAEAVARGEAPVNGCTAGGEKTLKMLAAIMGVDAAAAEKQVAVVFCKGGDDLARKKFDYDGIYDCKAAHAMGGAGKSCMHSCVGLGTCAKVCPFDAIDMSPDRLPVVDEEKCTGCRQCEINCPRFTIRVIPAKQKVHIRCNSIDKGALTKKNCDVGCIACNKCVKTCPIGAITMVDNLARIDPKICDGCQQCVSVCPSDTIECYIPGALKTASDYPKPEKTGKDEDAAEVEAA